MGQIACACCGGQTNDAMTDYCAKCVHRGCHIPDSITRDCWTDM